MRIAICDDVKLLRENLRDLIIEYKEREKCEFNIDLYESGEQLLEHYGEGYDLLLLDVEMKGCNGIETARRLREKDKKVIIIFTTAHLHYATEGYSVNAYRYLLKPISKECLEKELNSVIEEIKRNRSTVQVQEKNGMLITVEVNSILYVEAFGHENYWHLEDGTSICTTESLRRVVEWLELFEFFQVHKSYLVNLMKVVKFENELITLISDVSVPMSRRRYKEFKVAFSKAWEGKML